VQQIRRSRDTAFTGNDDEGSQLIDVHSGLICTAMLPPSLG
jgi:hypothetical protein